MIMVVIVFIALMWGVIHLFIKMEVGVQLLIQKQLVLTLQLMQIYIIKHLVVVMGGMIPVMGTN